MSTFHLYALTAVLLVALGLHGMFAGRHPLRQVMALNVVAGGVFLLLISTAYRDRTAFADPVPHAMVLTGIVVAISATGLALALVRRLDQGRQQAGSDPADPHEEGP